MGVHAGQTIKLQFGVYNDGVDGVTGIYVDDVSVEICFPSAQTATPTWWSYGQLDAGGRNGYWIEMNKSG